MEMTGGGKRGKPKPGFPSFPTALGNRGCDSHSPCAAWKSGKPKAGFPLFHLLFLSLKSNQERKPGGGSLRSRLQAHSSMRKCCNQIRRPPSRGQNLTGDMMSTKATGRPVAHRAGPAQDLNSLDLEPRLHLKCL